MTCWRCIWWPRHQHGLLVLLRPVGGRGVLIYQLWLIRARDRDACFRAFLNNNYFGMAVFVASCCSTSSHAAREHRQPYYVFPVD